jgi:acyl carrier protein
MHFTTTIGPDWHWVLAEHRMAGRQVFPGTSYVEMIASACREATGAAAVELRDLIFSQPLPVEGPRELRVSAEPQETPGWFSFVVASRSQERPDAPWERHATASAGRAADAEVPRVDVAQIAARCRGTSWTPDLTDPQNVVVFGPHWQVISSVTRGDGEQLAVLALPPGTDRDIGAFAVHPSLLDAATALSMYAPEVASGDQSFLPIAYDRILVREPLPARLSSHLRLRGRTGGISSYDVSLLDEGGREVVAISGFSVRAVDVAGVHAALTRDHERTGTGTGAPTLGLAQEELLIDADQATGLLWRMLDSRREPQYVVTIESLPDKTARLAGIAARVAQALSSAQRGTFAGTATRVASPSRQAAAAREATPTQRELLPLWEEAFALDGLGLDEDFFELGGNSLVAVQLAVRIRDHLQVNVPGIAVLEYPTVRMLADFVDTLRERDGEA